MFNSSLSTDLNEEDEENLVKDIVQFEPNIIAMLEAIPEPIIIIDQTGKIVLTNSIAQNLFNYTETEILNKPIESLMPECFRDKIKPIIESISVGRTTILDFHGLKKTCEEFPIDISLNSIAINEKMFILVGIKDLTKLQLYQQNLKEKTDELIEQISITTTTALLNKRQEEFINNVCHALRNTLNCIYDTVPLLIKSFNSLKLETDTTHQSSGEIIPCFTEVENYLKTIEQCAEQQRTILDNTLTLSKLEHNKVELNISSFELVETVTNTLLIFGPQFKQKNLKLLLDLPKNPVWLKTDPSQLSQIIINLTSNALKFTNVGYITVSAVIEPTLDLFTEDIIINFVVKDTGKGMLPHETSNLFQIFNQTGSHKHSITELGLAISKKMIELMGGSIQVESEVGHGTRVSFSIKGKYLNEEELLDAIQTKSLLNNIKTKKSILQRKKILIVVDDHNQINTSILFKQLNQHGCICYTATDGKMALELHAKNRFDLIYMDIETPLMNGLEVTKKIREKEVLLNYHTPVIGVSGYSGTSKKDLAIQCGMDDYLTKTYTPKELLEKIIEHIIVDDECQYKSKDERKKSVKQTLAIEVCSSCASQSSSTSNSPRPLVAVAPCFTPAFSNRDDMHHKQTDRRDTSETIRRDNNKCVIL